MTEIPNYPSNSRSRDKQVPSITSVPAEPTPKAEKVVQGDVSVRKPPLGKRIRESFAGDDAGTVGQYILFDVVVPTAKSLFLDVVSQGFERMLYGDTGRNRTSGGNGRRQYTDYASRSSSSRIGRPDPRDTPRSSANDGYRDLEFESRFDAENVVDKMREQMQDYGMCTVAYLYEIAGVTAMPNFQDNKWGWVDLRGVQVRGTPRSGYIIDLPRPVPID